MANYSIRLNDDLREEMRNVPDMADRIREFIEQEVRRQQYDARSDLELFCHDVIDRHGIVGAYCLEHLWRTVRPRYYLENLQDRFDGADVDPQEARLAAKQIRDEWNDLDNTFSARETVEDVIDQRGYYTEFHREAQRKVQNAVMEDEPAKWAYWAVYQHIKDPNSSTGGSNYYPVKSKALDYLLEYHGFGEQQIEDAKAALAKIGAFHTYYDSNAYSYHAIAVPDYLSEALEDGLQKLTRTVQSRVEDYCKDDPYLEKISQVTRSENDLYRKELNKDADGDSIKMLVQNGAVVFDYLPSRSSTGSRSSRASKTRCVLSPAVRQIVGDAYYRRNVQE